MITVVKTKHDIHKFLDIEHVIHMKYVQTAQPLPGIVITES